MGEEINLRLRELWEFTLMEHNFPADVHYYNEFGKLVMEECIKACQSRVGNSDYNTGRMHCVSDIKEHFGVK
jgi:hypothetical protein